MGLFQNISCKNFKHQTIDLVFRKYLSSLDSVNATLKNHNSAYIMFQKVLGNTGMSYVLTSHPFTSWFQSNFQRHQLQMG